MSQPSYGEHGEGLRLVRLLVVLSGLSPLFLLLALRGNNVFPEQWFIASCATFVVIPNVFLWARVMLAKKRRDVRSLTIGSAEDQRAHLLVYLFSILLPFYRQEIGDMRDFIALLVALAFIVFLFWHLNLHYMNIIFAVLGYRIFTVYPPDEENPYTGRNSFMLITRRPALKSGDHLVAVRLSDAVYFEQRR